jgi:dsRNA-specific ribonuclease
MTKKRRNGHARRRAFSEGDVHTRTKRARKQQVEGPSSSSGASADTVAHFQALQRSSHSALLADVFEWLGDAVIGELVGRCLLSQFHSSPLSARVFRNLRLSVVANRNLATVYEAMGYGAVRRRSLTEDGTKAGWKATNLKQRADVVEAVVGELVLKLHQQPSDPEGYRGHLDTVLAAMLHAHFADRTRAAEEKGEAVMSAKGPLSVAFNPFACLPEEQLDETTGELLVTDGVFDTFEDEQEERSCADLVDEYKGAAKAASGGSTHHYFVPVTADAVEEAVSNMTTAQRVKQAMAQLDEHHVLRASGEIFEVFKIYGMAVLSERMSLSLALPHMSIQQAKCSEMVTPARLTRQRQLVLSVANLAACAISLGIAERSVREEHGEETEEEAAARRVLEDHGLANTLRAFVGFHSAVAATSTAVNRQSNALVNDICEALYDAAFANQSEFSATALYSSKIPEREPLVAMMRSVGEARMFMNSKTCDDLHARGERPTSDAAVERKRKLKSTFLLRQCDSSKLEDLFETLNREQEAQRKRSQSPPAAQPPRKRTKKKKAVDGLAVNAGCVTQTLERFLHRRVLVCLEEIVVLFAQRKTEACRAQIALFGPELEPCADQPHLRKWEVTTSTLTLAMRDSFFRMLLHDICQFHAIVSSSRNTRDGTRITQLRLPLHYTWSNIASRITTEQLARS